MQRGIRFQRLGRTALLAAAEPSPPQSIPINPRCGGVCTLTAKRTEQYIWRQGSFPTR